jgi:hypothetical protein
MMHGLRQIVVRDSSTQISVILILVILDTTEAYDYFNGTLHALVQLDQF